MVVIHGRVLEMRCTINQDKGERVGKKNLTGQKFLSFSLRRNKASENLGGKKEGARQSSWSQILFFFVCQEENEQTKERKKDC